MIYWYIVIYIFKRPKKKNPHLKLESMCDYHQILSLSLSLSLSWIFIYLFILVFIFKRNSRHINFVMIAKSDNQFQTHKIEILKLYSQFQLIYFVLFLITFKIWNWKFNVSYLLSSHVLGHDQFLKKGTCTNMLSFKFQWRLCDSHW